MIGCLFASWVFLNLKWGGACRKEQTSEVIISPTLDIERCCYGSVPFCASAWQVVWMLLTSSATVALLLLFLLRNAFLWKVVLVCYTCGALASVAEIQTSGQCGQVNLLFPIST